MENKKTTRLVQMQEIQNEVKKRMKKSFTKIDDKKSGFVSRTAFFQICEVLDVKFSSKDKARCERQFEKDGQINYQEVLRLLGINPQTETWELRNLQAVHQQRNLRKSHTMQNATPLRQNFTTLEARRDSQGCPSSNVEDELTQSALQRIWDKQNNTIHFDDVSQANSRNSKQKPGFDWKNRKNRTIQQNRLDSTTLDALSNNAPSHHGFDVASVPGEARSRIKSNCTMSKVSRSTNGASRITSVRLKNPSTQLSQRSSQNSRRSNASYALKKTQKIQARLKKKNEMIQQEARLLKEVLQMLLKNKVNPQIINGLRYEANRFDSTKTGLILGKKFKDIFRHFNLKISHQDKSLMFKFFQMNGPNFEPLETCRSDNSSRNPLSDLEINKDGEVTPRKKPESKKRVIFCLNQINKLVDVFSKTLFDNYMASLPDEKRPLMKRDRKQVGKDRFLQMHSISKFPNSTLEVLLEELQNKLRINFGSISEAYAFFDVNQNQKCRPDHFLLCCQYFHLFHDVEEIIELFELIDSRCDGTLDEAEFASIFDGMKESWNSHGHSLMDSVLRMNRGTRFISNIKAGDKFYDISLADNTFEKLPPKFSEQHAYPYFFQKKQKHRSMFDGQTRTHYHQKKRVLSIVDKNNSQKPVITPKPTAANVSVERTLSPQQDKSADPLAYVLNDRLKNRFERMKSNFMKTTRNSRDVAAATVFDKPRPTMTTIQATARQGWESKRGPTAVSKQPAKGTKQVKRDTSIIKLMEGQYEAEHVEERRERDRQDYLENRLKKSNPRVFKNYIDNNTNYLRRQTQLKKLEAMKSHEQREEDIQKGMENNTIENFSYRNYNPESLKLLKPTLSINKLLNQTQKMRLRTAKNGNDHSVQFKQNELLDLMKQHNINSMPSAAALSHRLTKNRSYNQTMQGQATAATIQAASPLKGVMSQRFENNYGFGEGMSAYEKSQQLKRMIKSNENLATQHKRAHSMLLME